ncbi:hypothetical protein [Sedimentisphaera salicampi]|uniref:hypothetical protein n=1 Tax=Sedimentisphaera salicampi TaxID=1941349 RepID=UPI000B9B48AB|nr:hypothetical protein [Sedimentisphaera salicampi]OXU15723.1 hypothetical protein SMSP1_00510 [Sedimentisphaera salicampi]
MNSQTKKRGRPETLTAETAKQLFDLWQLTAGNIPDEQIAPLCGCTFGQLRGWLERPQVKVDIGSGKEPLRDIRTRAKIAVKMDYLQRIEKSFELAENNGDPSAMFKITSWLLEKQFPEDFGNRQKIDISGQSISKLRIDPEEASAAMRTVAKIKAQMMEGEADNG